MIPLSPNKWLAGMRRLVSRPQVAPRRLLFVFQGRQGHRVGMGRGLYAAEPVFRETVGQGCRFVAERYGISLQAAFERDEEAALVLQNEFHTVLVNALVQLGLAALWHEKGVRPEAVAGMSLGEITATVCAGALALEEAVAVACMSALWDERVTAKGKSLHLQADLATVRKLLRECPAQFDVFVETGPGLVTVFCLPKDLVEVAAFLNAKGVNFQIGGRENAYHIPRLAVDKSLVAKDLGFLQPQPPNCRFYSAMSGSLSPAGVFLDAGYWHGMVSRPVLFNSALEAALADGYDTILNIGPHPSLTEHIRAAAAKLGKDVLILDSLRDDEPETVTFNRAYEMLRGWGLGVGGWGVKKRRKRIAVAAPDVDLLAPEVVQDPYPFYEALRERGPVHWLEKNGFWLVVDYAETAAALKQPQVFSSQPAQGLDPVLIGADPPAHTRARQALAPFFAPSAVAELESFITNEAAQLWRKAAQKGAFDVVKEFAEPLADFTAAHLLGLDAAATNDLRQISSANRYQIAEHYQAVGAFFADYQIRGDGLARALREQFTPAEAASLLKALWLAGTTTTSMLITAATHWLLRLPSLRYEILDDLALLPPYLEEVLRFDAPEQTAWRVTTQATELGGVTIPTNAQVRLCLAAANRDPKHFANPASLVLSRQTNDHLAFGLGPHYCLGAALSRLEARVALSVWLQAAPELRAAQPLNAMRYVVSGHFRALESLPVRTE